MKAIGYEDVPTAVWDAVYMKWEAALRDGWRSTLWNSCTLCEHVHGHTLFRKVARRFNIVSADAVCRTCPLYDKWCASLPFGSRLNILYQHPTVPFRNEEAWKERVIEFLKSIKPLTSGDKP